MRSYTPVLVLAAALALLVGTAAGCVNIATETPTTAATPPTAVAGVAGTPTAIPCTPCATGTPPATATPVATAVAAVGATPSPAALAAATGAPPTAVPTATGAPAAGPAATSAPSPVAPAATATSARPAAATATSRATIAATQALTATPACCVHERCVVDNVALTVRNVSSGQAVAGLATPQPGQTLLVIDLTVESLGKMPPAEQAQFFKVRTQDGAEFAAREVVAEQASTPEPDQPVMLRAVFEVPQDAGDLTLVYSAPALGKGALQVDLGCSRPT